MRFPGYVVAVMAVMSLVVVAQAQTGLTGIDWQLVSLGPAGAETDAIPGTTVTLKLAEDSRVTGSTGCNSYGGTYEVSGDNIRFSRIVSTRRACLDQNANEQEHNFLTTLESANRFRLSSNRLAIFSDRGRSVLNFVNNPTSEPGDGPGNNRNDPINTLMSYYSAINSRDYRRAFGFWDSPPSSFEQFARGFADTTRVRLLVETPTGIEGAAGSVFIKIPAVVVSTTRSGGERVFANCYVMRRSNVQDRGWKIYRAEVSQMPSNTRLSRILSQGCRN